MDKKKPSGRIELTAGLELIRRQFNDRPGEPQTKSLARTMHKSIPGNGFALCCSPFFLIEGICSFRETAEGVKPGDIQARGFSDKRGFPFCR
ncbi:hypothetical protein TNIN_214141 [Trichonephila inaurata madagascariensis]|uniref:Uncharacterized protein n=1 Tax=Trichonephila inaurata madagascariensis TaxID=2747483 RepID=A0A8X7CNM5_9ARAC|nr:hypothetical protein TNIN_214141 [Trichonephila inaurata madagascariensis]